MSREGVLGKMLSLSFCFYVYRIGDYNCRSWWGVIKRVSDVKLVKPRLARGEPVGHRCYYYAGAEGG